METTLDSRHFVSWLHIGDLHASSEDGWSSVATLARIVDSIAADVPPGAIDFVYLPGDNADHGEREQYRRVASVLDRLVVPHHAIPGDHDFEPKSLAAFAETMGDASPAMLRIAGRRALFLDIVSAGSGGPDFRLGDAQLAWVTTQLAEAREADEPRPLVFMHAFPEDLHADAARIGRLFADAHVAMVDTGHTHYNEVLNDGAVIYAATRSTGQVEEGAAGFSIAAVDGDCVSWRFKALDAPWPWVLVTAPADARLTVAGARHDTDEVRALVLGADVASVTCRVDAGIAIAMRPVAGRPGLWAGGIGSPLPDDTRIEVTAIASTGAIGCDAIRVGHRDPSASDDALGRHSASVGAWPEHALLGTRLGPNAKGRKW